MGDAPSIQDKIHQLLGGIIGAFSQGVLEDFAISLESFEFLHDISFEGSVSFFRFPPLPSQV